MAGFAFLAICLFWVLLFIYSIHSALPYNAVKLPFEDYIKTQTFLPQGWKFFTRNPREEMVSMHARNDNNQWTPIIASNASPSNFFGVSRTSRAKSVEMGILLASVRDNDIDWIECKKSLQTCADEFSSNGSVVNKSPVPAICGEVVFLRQSAVPWAWSSSKKEIIMPSRIIKTNISCHQ